MFLLRKRKMKRDLSFVNGCFKFSICTPRRNDIVNPRQLIHKIKHITNVQNIVHNNYVLR